MKKINLQEIQQTFCSAMFDLSIRHDSFISSDFGAERLEIYRNNIFSSMRRALKITYPGICSLLGRDKANKIAASFCTSRINLPTSGCIDDWGEEFIDFLAQNKISSISPYQYIPSYALYEWIKQKTYHALHSYDIVSPSEFATISENIVPEIVLSLIPSCNIFSSEFPIYELDKMLNDNEYDQNNKPFTITKKNSHALIARINNEICTFWIEADLFLFCQSLSNKKNLTEASDIANAANPTNKSFNLTNALVFLLRNQLISRITLPISN